MLPCPIFQLTRETTSNNCRWLTEQDAVLAGTVAMRQDEFELVFDKVTARSN